MSPRVGHGGDAAAVSRPSQVRPSKGRTSVGTPRAFTHFSARLTLFVHPLVLGTGKRAFESGSVPSGLRLVEPAITSPKGVAVLRYEPTGAPPETGDMTVPG